MTINYKMCSKCVMDTTDPGIRFDDRGICNHCRQYENDIKAKVFSGVEGKQKLDDIVDIIKREGNGKKYDCIIGVSGGVDSTYVALKVKDLGLRPLAVHLDNGWDSELAVNNIANTLKKLDMDLYTHVIDWEEFKDLQVSFLKASTPDSEIPSDHAIFSFMYRMAEKMGVRYIISGFNVRTESHLPDAWSIGHGDWKYIESVHAKFGRVRLKTFPRMDFWTSWRYRQNIQWINILNYLDYVKKDAMRELEQKLGWKYYGGKHYESIYTRFYQGYILPRKFGYDKRRSHLSSLVCSGEMTRQDALEELKKDPYPVELQKSDREYVIKKLGLSEEGFETIMRLPKKTYWDYPSYVTYHQSLRYRIERLFYRIFHRVRRVFG